MPSRRDFLKNTLLGAAALPLAVLAQEKAAAAAGAEKRIRDEN